MSAILSEVDLNLLAAAKSQKPIDMIVAINSGANINAVDPSDGKSVLHHAAEGMDPFSLIVLIYESELHKDLLDAVAKDTDLDLIQVDLAIRRAQANLNPLVLDHEHRFASELVNQPTGEAEDFEDRTIELRAQLFLHVSYAEQDALIAAGVSEYLNDLDMIPLDQRLAAMAGISQPAPPPPAPA